MSELTFVDTTPREQNLDFSLLAQEIIVKLRGSLSQHELSQKLGFSFNQIGKWESGATIIHWHDFTQLCDALNIPWQRDYNSIFAFHRDMMIETTPVFESLSRFFGYASLTEMAQTLHKSRSAISRLQNNLVKIHFSDVLQVMDVRPFVLSSWLAKFLHPGELESFKTKYLAELVIYKGIVSQPEAALVNFCFHLQTYWDLPEHSDEWVGSKVGLNADEVSKAIEHLLSVGLIHRLGNKFKSVERELTTLRMPEFRTLIQYVSNWTTRVYNARSSFTPNIDNPSMSSMRLYPLSSTGGKEVIDALIKFHHHLAEIVKRDQGPKDHVRAILLHCVDMGISQSFSNSDTAKP